MCVCIYTHMYKHTHIYISLSVKFSSLTHEKHWVATTLLHVDSIIWGEQIQQPWESFFANTKDVELYQEIISGTLRWRRKVPWDFSQ